MVQFGPTFHRIFLLVFDRASISSSRQDGSATAPGLRCTRQLFSLRFHVGVFVDGPASSLLASSKAVACRGDTSSFDDTPMCPSAAEGSTKLAPNVGVLV
ncbi:conserved hypothetical protein [Trichinella spiralis]|uniref:hypothetical protein n=1 Tax=Trichinella spiralis TaxID=6334 RepID=UPI0001EFEB17|nr:conserved hypothetical protein [Trichinella spiralis]